MGHILTQFVCQHGEIKHKQKSTFQLLQIENNKLNPIKNKIKTTYIKHFFETLKPIKKLIKVMFFLQTLTLNHIPNLDTRMKNQKPKP